MATIDIIADRSTGTAVAGKAYFETSTNKFIVYTGTTWINIDSDGTGAFFENRWGARFVQSSSQYLTMPSLDLPTNKTVSFWVKLDSIHSSGVYLFGQSNSYYPYITGDGQTMYIYDGVAAKALSIGATHAVTTGSWIHIAITGDGSTASAYINGVLRATGVDLSPTGITRFAGDNTGRYIDGALDEVAVFNATLDAADITKIYNSGVPVDLTNSASYAGATDRSSNLLRYYRMGDHPNDSATSGGSIATITDWSGNGNDATQSTASNQPTFEVLDPLNRNYVQFDGAYQHLKATPTSSTDVYGVSAFVFLDSDVTPTSVEGVITSVSTTAILGLGGDITGALSDEIVLVYPAAAYAYADPNGSIPRGWHHFMTAWSPTSQINSGSPGYDLYLDGNVIGNVTNTQWGSPSLITMSSGGPFYVGSRGGSMYAWSGLVDEIAVFGTQLTSSDITSIYNNGVPGDISALNPAGWWRMGDDDSFVPGDAVSQVTDHSGNGLHLEQTTANYMRPIAGASNSIYKES